MRQPFEIVSTFANSLCLLNLFECLPIDEGVPFNCLKWLVMNIIFICVYDPQVYLWIGAEEVKS